MIGIGVAGGLVDRRRRVHPGGPGRPGRSRFGPMGVDRRRADAGRGRRVLVPAARPADRIGRDPRRRRRWRSSAWHRTDRSAPWKHEGVPAAGGRRRRLPPGGRNPDRLRGLFPAEPGLLLPPGGERDCIARSRRWTCSAARCRLTSSARREIGDRDWQARLEAVTRRDPGPPAATLYRGIDVVVRDRSRRPNPRTSTRRDSFRAGRGPARPPLAPNVWIQHVIQTRYWCRVALLTVLGTPEPTPITLSSLELIRSRSGRKFSHSWGRRPDPQAAAG